MILERFLGKNGQRKVLGAVLEQELVLRNPEAANRIAECLELEGVPEGKEIITETEAGQDALLMVLSGKFQLYVKGYPAAEIVHGQAVGEYPILFPGEKHRATVRAIEDSVIGRLAGEDLELIAQEYPVLWKNMARFVEARLIKSGQARPWANSTTRIFIGSSSESLPVARDIEQEFACDPFDISLWTDDEVFRLSKTYIESLEQAALQNDFAILMFQGEDTVESRRKKQLAPRDNVIFEAGLFMGRLGRERTILVTPQGLDIKIPSDLLGLKQVSFSSPDKLRPVANIIRKHVLELGPLQRSTVI
ncbi:MAG: TIR domain-containing protein [Nitrospirales bacterium]